MKKNIAIAILAIILIGLITYDCTRQTPAKIVTIKTFDTTHTVTTVTNWEPYEVINYDTLIVDSLIVDSAYCRQLATDYFALRKYDTITQNDSNATVRVSADVQKNKLLKLWTDVKINRPTTVTTVVQEAKIKRIGIGALVSPVNTSLIGSYHGQNSEMIIGYDFHNKVPQVGVIFKIW